MSASDAEKVAALAADTPVLAFFRDFAAIREISRFPGWAGVTGADSQKRRVEIFEDFNNGRFDGLAVSYGVARMGVRFPSAKTMVFVDPVACPATMAQAAARAPQAKTVLL